MYTACTYCTSRMADIYKRRLPIPTWATHMKQKNITIREEQDDWIKKNHINLSSLVREAIENKREQY